MHLEQCNSIFNFIHLNSSSINLMNLQLFNLILKLIKILIQLT